VDAEGAEEDPLPVSVPVDHSDSVSTASDSADSNLDEPELEVEYEPSYSVYGNTGKVLPVTCLFASHSVAMSIIFLSVSLGMFVPISKACGHDSESITDLDALENDNDNVQVDEKVCASGVAWGIGNHRSGESTVLAVGGRPLQAAGMHSVQTTHQGDRADSRFHLNSTALSDFQQRYKTISDSPQSRMLASVISSSPLPVASRNSHKRRSISPSFAQADRCSIPAICDSDTADKRRRDEASAGLEKYRSGRIQADHDGQSGFKSIESESADATGSGSVSGSMGGTMPPSASASARVAQVPILLRSLASKNCTQQLKIGGIKASVSRDSVEHLKNLTPALRKRLAVELAVLTGVCRRKHAVNNLEMQQKALACIMHWYDAYTFQKFGTVDKRFTLRGLLPFKSRQWASKSLSALQRSSNNFTQVRWILERNLRTLATIKFNSLWNRFTACTKPTCWCC
jgi:hypothetical protein